LGVKRQELHKTVSPREKMSSSERRKVNATLRVCRVTRASNCGERNNVAAFGASRKAKSENYVTGQAKRIDLSRKKTGLLHGLPEKQTQVACR